MGGWCHPLRRVQHRLSVDAVLSTPYFEATLTINTTCPLSVEKSRVSPLIVGALSEKKSVAADIVDSLFWISGLLWLSKYRQRIGPSERSAGVTIRELCNTDLNDL